MTRRRLALAGSPLRRADERLDARDARREPAIRLAGQYDRGALPRAELAEMRILDLGANREALVVREL